MRRVGLGALITILALVGPGCRRQAPQPTAQPPTMIPGTTGVQAARAESEAGRQPAARQQLPVPRADTMGRMPSLAAIAGSSTWVGRRVRLDGWCIGAWVALAPGGAPRSKSDWVLTDDTTRLYVVGAIPHDCPASGRSSMPVTIDAVVFEDTVALVLSGPPSPRRFLVRVGY